MSPVVLVAPGRDHQHQVRVSAPTLPRTNDKARLKDGSSRPDPNESFREK
jgi:hypothetical protein